MVFKNLYYSLCDAFNKALPENAPMIGLPFPDSYLALPKLTAHVAKQEAVIEEQKQKYTQYYHEKIAYIRDFFQEESFEVASILLDYLLHLKTEKIKDPWRKNGYIPQYGHEIDQVLNLVTALKKGELSNKRSEIEEKYGSVEKWVCAILCHDIGEDFNVFPKQFSDELQKRLIEKYGHVSDQNNDLINRATRSMIRLTHYYKYSIDDFENLVTENYSLPTLNIKNIKPDETIALDDYKDFFRDKVSINGVIENNLQVFMTWHEDNEKPHIIATRYGMAPESLPVEDQLYGIDWVSYIQKLIRSGTIESDFYDILTKLNDRVHGLSTRIAVKPFSVKAFSEYLDYTETLFSTLDASNLLKHHIYLGSPLESTITSIDGMMRATYAVDKFFLAFHPDSQIAGKKGMSIHNLADAQKYLGTSFIKLADLKQAMNEFYKHTPTDSHPVTLQMRDLNEAIIELPAPYEALRNMPKDAYKECGLETEKPPSTNSRNYLNADLE